MKCPNCGKEIAEGSNFCNFCGKNFSEEKQPKKNSKQFKTFLLILLAVFCVYSISEYRKKKNIEEYYNTHKVTIPQFQETPDNPSESNNSSDNPTRDNSQALTICPICGGTGVHEIIPGDIMAPCCHGNKKCTQEEADMHLQFRQQAEELVTGGKSSSPSGRRSGRSAYEIKRDLDKAYKMLDDMENQYRDCRSRTLAAQYPSMIAKQRERIQRLEDELRHASN